jgi:hypothetical protein
MNLSLRSLVTPVTGAWRGKGIPRQVALMSQTEWVYWILIGESGMWIGFCRENNRATEYANLRTDRWHREPILYADRAVLRNPPQGLLALRSCE